MIRRLNLNDTDQVKRITEACAEHMNSQGIDQWNQNYPSLQIIQKDAINGTLYGYASKENGKIVGAVMFGTEKDDFYSEIKWKTVDTRHIYVHRLAVHPDYQGQVFHSLPL